MVILNCPICTTPLVYYKTKCFVLSDQQVERIRNSRQDTTVLKILHNITKAQNTKVPITSDDNFDCEVPVQKYMVSPLHEDHTKQHISKDDILDLRIKLETCIDSQAFINSL